MKGIDENIDQIEFQEVIGAFITKLGFKINSVESTPDGSSEFEVQTHNPVGGIVTSIIRASPYTRHVTKDDVEDLYETMMAKKAIRSAYITTSEFSKDSIEYSSEKPISLIDKYQIIDTVEKHGLVKDTKLMQSLEKYGLGERHIQDKEQTFIYAKGKAEEEKYFRSKISKTFLGKPLEKPVKITLRYAPIEQFRIKDIKDVFDQNQQLRKIEKRDYIFVNLNNLDIYYVIRSRKRNKLGYQFHRTDVLRKVSELPAGPKDHLIHILEHGDLPLEDIAGKDYTILKNNKVVTTYTGNKDGKSLTDQISDGINAVLDVLIMTVNSLLTGSEEDEVGADEEEKKMVTHSLNLPHEGGGEYDILKYLYMNKGRERDVETDPITHSSREVSTLMKSLFQADTEGKGIIFMPYKRCRYEKMMDGTFSKYEILVAPLFKGDDVQADEKDQLSDRQMKKRVNRDHNMPKIKTRGSKRAFKLIR